MHIIENSKITKGKTYCYASKCLWDPLLKKYTNPSIAIGHLEGDPPLLVPNNHLSALLRTYVSDPGQLDDQNQDIIKTVIAKYGQTVLKNIQDPKRLFSILTNEAK